MQSSLAVVTLHTPEIAKIAELTLPSKQLYCDWNRYALISETQTLDPSRPPAWSKILLLKRWLPMFEWLFWIDADAMVMEPSVAAWQFTKPDVDLVLSRDVNGLNTGVFMIRNTPTALEFLDIVDAQRQFTYDRWWEQAAMQYVIAAKKSPIKVHEVERIGFNTYPYDYKDGHFILHAVGDGDKLSILQPYAAKFAEKYQQPKRGFPFQPPSIPLAPRVSGTPSSETRP